MDDDDGDDDVSDNSLRFGIQNKLFPPTVQRSLLGFFLIAAKIRALSYLSRNGAETA